MGRKRKKRIAIQGFKHKKVPSHPVGCRGFLVPLRTNQEMLVCNHCHWMVNKTVASKYGWMEEKKENVE
jgi:hypothetical protein